MIPVGRVPVLLNISDHGSDLLRHCFPDLSNVSLEFKGPQCIALAGFSLYAARLVGSEDRRNLSQLINYMARPPIAEDRLERTASDDILYKLKEAWSNGTIGIQLSPSELIETLIQCLPRTSNVVLQSSWFPASANARYH